MVARGDLGIELPLESMPPTQKRLIRLAGSRSKPSVTATQMLASMVDSDRPTRAEVTDVANAIYDGTDAVMLSEETAVGSHPLAAVRIMDRIARQTELDLPYDAWLRERVTAAPDDVAASVAQSAVASTYRLGLRAIVVPTRSGRTARLVSALRPRVPIVAISPRKETVTAAQPAVRRALLLPRRVGGSASAARRVGGDRRASSASPRPASSSRSPPGSPIRS